MRARTTILGAIAAATALGLPTLAPAAEAPKTTATAETRAATKSVDGRLLAAPRPGALVRRSPVRVAVRVPPQTTRLWVRAGGRNVSKRFRQREGSLRVARLGRGDGLRYGRNHLVVIAARRGAAPLIDSRSFVLARRDSRLVGVRVEPGPATKLRLRLARGGELAAEHFGVPGEVKRRLAVHHRERDVRVWLNGRRVTAALERARPTLWTASLSASHRLRHGVNRLRVLVSEPGRGRYAEVRRSFVVRRTHHLPAAGWDTAGSAGGLIRLDGRRSRAAGGGPLAQRWKILVKPQGSHAKLRGAGSARPLLSTDRRGRYVVGLTVSSRGEGATASRAQASGDTVEVIANPQSLLVPFQGLATENGRHGIKVGGTFYPNESPGGSAVQWLTLDRRSLTPVGSGNSWLDGGRDGGHGIGALAATAASLDVNYLVVLSFPGGGGAPIQQAQIGAFNDALQALGVEPFEAGVLEGNGKLAVAGVPAGGAGSGQSTHGGAAPTALNGWLMPDALKDDEAFRFRFQSERPEFDTSAASTATSNTMMLRGTPVQGTLPSGATTGFHVVKFDPVDFTLVDQQVFGVHFSDDDPQGHRRIASFTAMVKYLNENPHNLHVAVQTIGMGVGAQLGASRVGAGEPGTWQAAGSALSAYGANPHYFNEITGHYAFVGGPTLERGEVAESSVDVVLDPVDNRRESGTLKGRATMRSDGYFVPVAADPTGSLEFSLYDVAFRAPTPWPYTPGGEFPEHKSCGELRKNSDEFERALAFVAEGIHLPKTQADVRSAYLKRDQMTWSDAKVDLLALKYEGGLGFNKAAFCNLQAQLQQEFDWLDDARSVFETYEKVLSSSGNLELADLQKIAKTIQASIAIAKPTAEVGWSVGGFVGNLISAGLVLDPEGAVALAAWEGLVTVYELGRELTSELSGVSDNPVGDEVESKVESLGLDVASRLADASNALVRLREVIITDPGRLQAFGEKIEKEGLAVDPPSLTHGITSSASAFFSNEIVPVPYGVHALVWKVNPDIIPEEFPDQCVDGVQGLWLGTPASAKMFWGADFSRDGQHGRYPSLFVLGRHELSIRYWAYPPAEVTDPMFMPPTQKAFNQYGFGMHLPRFVWEQYAKGFPPTDIYYCT
ncbi:MAG TPA: hypothetical protein VFX85_08065 [Solirubrobacterales bacterium]|nr:hypothetical protein [Solirubrobacterales bacterium]